MASPGDERQDAAARPSGLGRALLLTAASLVLPGIAHLRTGRRTAGIVLLSGYALAIAALVAAGVLLFGDVTLGASMAVQGRWLLTASAIAFAGTVVWMAVVVHSWVITRPRPSRAGAATAGGALVVVLCAVAAAPAAAVMHTSYVTYSTLSSVFGSVDPLGEPPHDAADPWNGRDRIEVLLIGGDSGSNRYGMRNDSTMLASIDVHTGDVVLIGIPRNLEDVQFPEGSKLAEAYPPPAGFDDLFNEVYQAVAENPEQLAENPAADDPSADTLKSVVGHMTGLEPEYYALVDMKGFEGIIDAIGGIDVYLEDPIPYGLEGDILPAGQQHLDGNQALWYGRSRVNSDDYTRMGRQGCLLKYVVEQADPTAVLRGYQDLAGAAKRTLRTDIPQTKVPAFIELADLIDDEGSMKTLQLTPPQVDPAYPDWKEIRAMVADAVNEQEQGQGDGADAAPGPDPSPSGPSSDPSGGGAAGGQDGSPEGQQGPEGGDDTTEWQEYTGLDDPSPTTPGRQVGDDAGSLDALCP
ncbi:LCP family protein [Nocardiopsis suaedae]|uniref:LCP family protein n=1 Tax=Nocardiopsis suaedae TaxID=3018444 RepID=A0ABT4TS47_9ACTN|nr:LCP family protein [Nocardiopsis suaedae]MDA2807521.1 LCP family protein [Nocardiopsis suaedae]